MGPWVKSTWLNIETKQKVALKLLNSQLASEDGVKLFKQECDLLNFSDMSI